MMPITYISLFHILLLTIAVPLLTAADSQYHHCLIPKQTKHHVIYLEGLAERNRSLMGTENYSDIKKISDELNLAVSMIKGNGICKTNYRCWRQANKNEVSQTMNYIIETANLCLQKSNNKPSGIIGFSNGGYLLAKWLQYCIRTPFAFMIAIGSAGDSNLTTGDLSGCGKLDLMIGTKDISFNKAHTFIEKLKKQKAEIEFVTFSGSHIVPYLPLRRRLLKILEFSSNLR